MIKCVIVYNMINKDECDHDVLIEIARKVISIDVETMINDDNKIQIFFVMYK